jgi:hypothetical protein
MRDRLDDKEPEPLMLGHAARACRRLPVDVGLSISEVAFRVDLAVNRVQLGLRLCEIAPASTTMAQTKADSLGNHIDDRE